MTKPSYQDIPQKRPLDLTSHLWSPGATEAAARLGREGLGKGEWVA